MFKLGFFFFFFLTWSWTCTTLIGIVILWLIGNLTLQLKLTFFINNGIFILFPCCYVLALKIMSRWFWFWGYFVYAFVWIPFEPRNVLFLYLNCRFIYTFLGLGVALCVITCSGHVAAETANGCCLYLVSFCLSKIKIKR